MWGHRRELQTWLGFIAVPTEEAALLEAIARIRAVLGKHLRMRFLVNVTGSSPLWRQRRLLIIAAVR